MKSDSLEHLPVSAWNVLIDEWIFSERDRSIVRDHLINGITYEQIAEKHGMSTRQIFTIVDRARKKLALHIPK